MLNAAVERDDARKSRVLVLCGSASFAAMYVCVKLTSPTVSSFEVLFARSVLGAVLCFALLRHAGRSARWGSWKLNLMRASFGFASIASQFVAMHEGGASLSMVSFLRHAAPVWMLLFAGPFLGEWPDRRAKLAVGVGLVGTLLALGPSGSGATWATALAAGAGLFAALALLSVRKLTATDHPLTVVMFFMVFITVVTAPIVVWRWSQLGFAWSARDAALVGGSALLGTLGQLSITSAYRYGSAVSTAVSALAEVVFTLLLAWTIAGDPLPPWTTFAGGSAILAAGWIATRRKLHKA
ncbi:MAG: DMT family transporter [Planctomycetes bacterium]|nr:DMT family transporter [Planctomycetota bacterium]